MTIEEKLAARAARAKAEAERPALAALRRHGLEECGCGSWIARSSAAREFHASRCGGSTYAKEGS